MSGLPFAYQDMKQTQIIGSFMFETLAAKGFMKMFNILTVTVKQRKLFFFN